MCFLQIYYIPITKRISQLCNHKTSLIQMVSRFKIINNIYAKYIQVI